MRWRLRSALPHVASFCLLVLGACAAGDPPPPRPASVDLEPEVATRDAVREEIRFAWARYREHAWGMDELRPLTRTGTNWHDESLGLTIVDSLSTLHVVGLEAERDEALAWIRDELRFDHDIEVSVFETNIRILGGLLSGWALTGEPALLAKARDLGDRLLPAFATESGLPYRLVNLRTGQASNPSSDVAEVGTFLLEFGALSRFTGDPKYEAAARRAIGALDALRGAETGLLPGAVDAERGRATLPVASVGGGVDSYFEYLAKGSAFFDEPALMARYEDTIGPIHAYLADERENGLWYGWASMETGEPLAPISGALDCFFPGLLAYAGDIERARRVADSCWLAWETFGALPDAYRYDTLEVVAANHELRPELAESFFYLARLTGEPVWRERGRRLFEGLVEGMRVPGGYAVLRDVRTGEHGDGMPSFFLAETLKYLYLLFADESVVPLDEWVFNTEAHPLPLPE